jgi:hypothetical protein
MGEGAGGNCPSRHFENLRVAKLPPPPILALNLKTNLFTLVWKHYPNIVQLAKGIIFFGKSYPSTG